MHSRGVSHVLRDLPIEDQTQRQHQRPLVAACFLAMTPTTGKHSKHDCETSQQPKCKALPQRGVVSLKSDQGMSLRGSSGALGARLTQGLNTCYWVGPACLLSLFSARFSRAQCILSHAMALPARSLTVALLGQQLPLSLPFPFCSVRSGRKSRVQAVGPSHSGCGYSSQCTKHTQLALMCKGSDRSPRKATYIPYSSVYVKKKY